MTEIEGIGLREDARGRGAGIVAVGGLIGAIGATSCCILPVMLFSLGAGGAWVEALTALAPYQPYIVGATIALIGFGYWLAHWRAHRARVAGTVCGEQGTSHVVHVALWSAIALVLASLSFPYAAPFILG